MKIIGICCDCRREVFDFNKKEWYNDIIKSIIHNICYDKQVNALAKYCQKNYESTIFNKLLKNKS